jgi:hypothetical protein
MGENDFATNGNDGMVMFSNTRWSIGTEWRLGYTNHHGYETETYWEIHWENAMVNAVYWF